MFKRLLFFVSSVLFFFYPLPAYSALDYGKQTLIGSDFSNIDLKGATFYLSDLQDSDFSGSDLQGASFFDAKLENANLSNTNMRDVTMDAAILNGANLSNSILEGAFAYIAIFENVIIEGEDFSLLAEEFSEDPGSAKKGGDLGWTGLGVFTPIFEEIMLSSEIGDISEVFESEFGFHFLEVIDKRNYELTNDLIEDRAYNMLYARKYEEELENTLRTMRAEAFVEFKDLD